MSWVCCMFVDSIHPLPPNTLMTLITDTGLNLPFHAIKSFVEFAVSYANVCSSELQCMVITFFCVLCVLGQAAQASLSQNTNPHLLKKGCPNRFSSPMRPSTDTLDSGERSCVPVTCPDQFQVLNLTRLSLISCPNGTL